MKVLILSNGTINDMSIVKNLSKEVDMIVCADGGAKHIYESGIIPDIVIGDLDSIDIEVYNKLAENNVEFVKYPTKKDKTDTELAINYAIEKGATEILLLGATGTRLDHTLANIMLLFKLLKLGVKGKIVDDNNEVFLLQGEIYVEKENDSYISIIPILQEETVVTLDGFEYDTNNIILSIGSTLGISNRLEGSKGRIKIDNGVCLIFKSKD